MKYDFEKIINREGTSARAIDVMPIKGGVIGEGFSKIPMWVADMNFEAAPSIVSEIEKRLSHKVYGYFNIQDEYYDAIINWQQKRNNVENLKKENIGYENGVLGGVVNAANILTPDGGDILVHSPTYVGFTWSLTNRGYNLVHSDLYIDSSGVWRMNYEDMEEKIVKNKIHTAVFCNPHNPTGRLWTKEEIEKAYAIFKKHDVYVIEDCIWSDIVLNGNKFTPAQSVNEDAKMRTISFYAPSKTFNLAGLVGSYHIVYNKRLNDLLLKESSLCIYNEPNVFSISALIGAYCDEGQIWADELCEVISENINYAYDFIGKNFKGVDVKKPEGTYLMYLDAGEFLKENDMTLDELLLKGVSVGVVWQDGRPFHRENSIRMNFALPHSLVVEALSRLDKYVFNKN